MPLVLYQTDGPIATITFNRPETLNALDEPVGLELGKIFKTMERDKNVRVAILTGSGRAFSSGGNLDMIEGRTKKKIATNKHELKKFYRVFLNIRNLRVPVIGAINGHAIGAGFCLALACDLRYAASTAKMGANFSRLGLAPGMGGTYLITRLVGPMRAAEILLLAENLSASRAHDMGLLNGVFEPEHLMSHVHGVARVIAENGPLVIAHIKKGIQKVLHATLEQMFDYDSAAQAASFATEDIREGIRAIREKRPPNFDGK